MKSRARLFLPLHGLLAVFGAALWLAACSPGGKVADDKDAPARLETARFADLPGWAADDHRPALAALRVSCPRLEQNGAGAFGGAADWRPVCAEAARAETDRTKEAARLFFERNFVPVRVAAADGSPDGLITGYYEPELAGARLRGGRFTVPLYLRPPDLVAVDLGRFSADLAGKQIAGRVDQGRLLPYHDRAGIEGGALRNRKLELVWVDSATDKFFLQIQGSGRVVLQDGSVMRVGYAGTNGRPYTAIGRALIDRGIVEREKMSMQAIREWLAANPEEGATLMRTNESYVFFRELTGPGPIGALGVPLTPGRSLAIDRRRFPLGMPVWLDTVLPDDDARPMRRLMVAQDTGGAIRGAVRADVFWGHGKQAAERAGRMKSPGRYWFLRPRSVATAAAPAG